MAKTDENVMAMVEAELEKEPGIDNSTLQDRVKSKFPHIGKLTLRQFHARYPLQIKRRKSRNKAKKEKKASKPKTRARSSKRARTAKAKPAQPAQAASGGGRDAVRQVLLGFAADLSAADDRSQVVKVLANVDGYVDDLIKAAAD